jgi:hypothetical protein
MNRMNYFPQFMCFESFRNNRKAIAPTTPADSNLDTAQVVRLKKRPALCVPVTGQDSSPVRNHNAAPEALSKDLKCL